MSGSPEARRKPIRTYPIHADSKSTFSQMLSPLQIVEITPLPTCIRSMETLASFWLAVLRIPLRKTWSGFCLCPPEPEGKRNWIILTSQSHVIPSALLQKKNSTPTPVFGDAVAPPTASPTPCYCPVAAFLLPSLS